MRNGARSLGPCTPEGKERSRQNWRKHDLTSALFTPAYLSSPDHAEYTAMLHDLIDEFDPRTRSAMSAVEGGGQRPYQSSAPARRRPT